MWEPRSNRKRKGLSPESERALSLPMTSKALINSPELR
jgi:hypothetical protein